MFALVALCSTRLLSAQCAGGFDLGNDTTLCDGGTLVLNAGAGYETYLWDNGSTAQTRVIYGAGTYTCQVTGFDPTGDLVVNGDFSGGSTGFTSDYIPGTGGSWGLLSLAGQYAVTTNASLVHNNFHPCTDHTSGGEMLVVNGADTPDQSVWCQTVTVQPGTDYAFSAWLLSVVPSNPAVLDFTINGVPIGSPLTASSLTCTWQDFYAVWNSGGVTSATICITNQNAIDDGNDFALDDISFAPFCTWTDGITVTEQASPTPDLGPDIEVCQGVPVTLSVAWPAADAIGWSTGSASGTINITTAGLYWVDVTEGGCTGRDSAIVVFKPLPNVELGPPIDICAGTSVVLDASFPGAGYTWQNGSHASTFQAGASGLYQVTVDLDGCTAQDAVQVTVQDLPTLELGADTAICDGTSITLDATRPGGIYQWADGPTTGVRTLTVGGLYRLVVTEGGCSRADSIMITVIPLPTVDQGPDFLLCEGTYRVLELESTLFSASWQDGSTAHSFTVTGPGLFGVTLSDACDTVSDSLSVVTDRCDCPIYVPNAFTPDADDLNDGFLPLFSCEVTHYLFRVYDRWGRILWSSTDPHQAWDGLSSSGPVPDGLYNWTLSIRTNTVHDGGNRSMQGHMVVLR